MPRCRNCKQKFIPKSLVQKHCFDNIECIKEGIKHFKELQQKAFLKSRQKEKVEKKKSLMTLSDWIKIAQATFNHFINLRDKKLNCISCNKPINGRVNASHYFNSNNHYSVRFNEDNVHSSCITCNQYLSGNLIPYRKYLIEKIGIERFEQLETKAYLIRKFTIEEVKEINEIYKLKIKQL